MIYGAVRCMQGYLSEHERIIQIWPKDDTLVVTSDKRSFVVDHTCLGWNKTKSPNKPAQVANILDLCKFAKTNYTHRFSNRKTIVSQNYIQH